MPHAETGRLLQSWPFVGAMPKSTPTKLLCPIGDDSDYEDYADEDYDDVEFINRMGMKSKPKSSETENIHNPHKCPMPSQMQLTGNQCIGKKDKRIICCKAGYSWVQCSKACPPNPPTAPDAEDFDLEDYAGEDSVEDYEAEFINLGKKSEEKFNNRMGKKSEEQW